MDWQNALVVAAVIAAALYLARRLWPRRGASAGCADCAAAPKRHDDRI